MTMLRNVCLVPCALASKTARNLQQVQIVEAWSGPNATTNGWRASAKDARESAASRRARKDFDEQMSELRKQHAEDVRVRKEQRSRNRRENARLRAKQREQHGFRFTGRDALQPHAVQRTYQGAASSSSAAHSNASRSDGRKMNQQNGVASAARELARTRKTEAQIRHVQTLRQLQHEKLRQQSGNWIRREELTKRIEEALDNPQRLL